MKKLYIYITILIFGVAFNENTNPQLHDNQIAKKMFQAIWDQAMAVSYTHLTLPTIYSV